VGDEAHSQLVLVVHLVVGTAARPLFVFVISVGFKFLHALLFGVGLCVCLR
jgi:hypothetical protein